MTRSQMPRFAADLEATPFALSFRKGELETLLDGKYGGPYTFPLLAMFYPSLTSATSCIRTIFTPGVISRAAQLRKRGIPDELHEQFMERIDLIPNLQLLEGQPNIEKAATPFAEWLAGYYPETDKRSDYLKRNFIPTTDYDLGHFLNSSRAAGLATPCCVAAIGWSR